MKLNKALRIAGFAGIMAAVMAVSASAYDKYAPVYRNERAPSATSRVAANFLTYPFEVIRYPIDRTLVTVEKNHLDTKAKWMYDTVKNHGIYPHIGAWNSFGADVDFVQLANKKTDYPDLLLKSGFRWDHQDLFKVSSDVGFQDLGDTGIGPEGFFSYENRPEEDFYGIGPHSSAGNGSSYKNETTLVGTRIDYNPNPTLHGDVFFDYRNVNITNGEDGRLNVIDTQFPAGSIPGLSGDEMLEVGLNFSHDSRNHKENSSRGGLRRIGFGFHEGLGSSNARYLKYEGELSQYFKLWSERRVVAVRFIGEYNDEVGEHSVPFHQMAKLGGYGMSSSETSHTFRAYDENRFFGEGSALLNLEYRYAIYEYREFKMDTVVFWDEGQAFREFSKFSFGDLKASYGMGFRVSVADHTLMAIELAHGDEGTNFYVKSRTPF